MTKNKKELKKTIAISEETKLMLDKLIENKTDTYEDIIKRLLK